MIYFLRNFSYIILLFLLTAFLACNYQPYEQGKRLYGVHCANCHAEDGSGLKKLIPPVSDSDFIKMNTDKLSCLIKFGFLDTLIINGVSYSGNMKGIPNLTDTEIANIINYIIYEFEYESSYFSENHVRDQLSQCK